MNSSERVNLKRISLLVKCSSANWNLFLQGELIKYLQAIGSDENTTLVNLFKELLGPDRMTEALQSKVLICFCRTAHIYGISSSTMEDVVSAEDVHVLNSVSRKLQSIFAAYKFYGRKLQRVFVTYNFYGIVMLRLDSIMGHTCTAQQGYVTNYKVFFAKVLGILEIRCPQ